MFMLHIYAGAVLQGISPRIYPLVSTAVLGGLREGIWKKHFTVVFHESLANLELTYSPSVPTATWTHVETLYSVG